MEEPVVVTTDELLQQLLDIANELSPLLQEFFIIVSSLLLLLFFTLLMFIAIKIIK